MLDIIGTGFVLAASFQLNTERSCLLMLNSVGMKDVVSA
jgi:hypothetical protein